LHVVISRALTVTLTNAICVLLFQGLLLLGLQMLFVCGYFKGSNC